MPNIMKKRGGREGKGSWASAFEWMCKIGKADG